MTNPIQKLQEQITSICNITYKSVNGQELQLDVFVPSKKLGEEPWYNLTENPTPTLVYYHGGGWVEGDRFSRFLEVLPYLEKGWSVVNVDYRLLQEAPLLEGIHDCLDALNWVHDHAHQYNFDLTKVYVSGESAGGHLALLTGMMDEKSLETLFESERRVQVAGIINWFGISDVAKAIDFWNSQEYEQMINQESGEDLNAFHRHISPMAYVSKMVPPVISIHGDADINVPVNQSKTLHEMLDEYGVRNKLIIIPGKKHGGFLASELEEVYGQLWNFIN